MLWEWFSSSKIGKLNQVKGEIDGVKSRALSKRFKTGEEIYFPVRQ